MLTTLDGVDIRKIYSNLISSGLVHMASEHVVNRVLACPPQNQAVEAQDFDVYLRKL